MRLKQPKAKNMSKKFIILLSFTTISSLFAPVLTSFFEISWQAYCLLQGSILSVLSITIDDISND